MSNLQCAVCIIRMITILSIEQRINNVFLSGLKPRSSLGLPVADGVCYVWLMGPKSSLMQCMDCESRVILETVNAADSSSPLLLQYIIFFTFTRPPYRRDSVRVQASHSSLTSLQEIAPQTLTQVCFGFNQFQ